VNVNLSYTGSQTDTVFSFPFRTVTLNAYTLANVTGEFSLTPWLTLFGRAENLFNEKQQDIAGFQNPGRGFHFGFRMGEGR
jgi:vitamin B12 transporter